MSNETFDGIRKGNLVRSKKLTGDYRRFYLKIQKDMASDVRKGMDMENALSDILDMLEAAMEEKKPVGEIFGSGYDGFYKALLEVLPAISQDEKRAAAKRKVGRLTLSLTAAVLALALLIVWNTGLIGLWRNGISFAAGSLERYSYHHSLVEGVYKVEIDLSDLESNKGKVLYDDGECRITVLLVDNTGSASTGGYRISFRSSGSYNLQKAVLVSGQKHYATQERSFSNEMTAKMTTEYKGKTYESTVFGMSGLNYKDGDEFAFYLFPGESYESKEISLDETGVVSLKLTNLSRNIWSKK